MPQVLGREWTEEEESSGEERAEVREAQREVLGPNTHGKNTKITTLFLGGGR